MLMNINIIDMYKTKQNTFNSYVYFLFTLLNILVHLKSYLLSIKYGALMLLCSHRYFAFIFP